MKIHLLAMAGLLVGCGVNTGFVRDATTLNQHQYIQQVGTVRYVKSVDASTETSAYLCFVPSGASMNFSGISLGGDPPYATTMGALYKKAGLEPNQVLENLREDHSYRTYLGLYCTSVLTISGDVIELLPVGVAPPQPSPEKDGSPCGVAYGQSALLVDAFRRIYPNATAAARPPLYKTFVDVCSAQTEEVQMCLQARRLREHADECKQTFQNMKASARRDLFAMFVVDTE